MPNRRSSGRPMNAATAGGAVDASGHYGFRRVEHVHIVIGEPTIAMVTGICHRYSHSVRVPLGVAARFVAAGAPLTVEGAYRPHEAAGV